MVKFCPNCEKVLRKKKNSDTFIFYCPNPSCNYTEPYTKVKRDKKTSKRIEKKILDNKTRVVDEEKNSVTLLPKTKEVCPECNNGEAYYEQFQTRSADEPATTFYTCVACKHKWREY